MNAEKFRAILSTGETIAVEFKRCGNGIEHDTYESVCAFLNRFGGDLFMGVLDDGKVVGVPDAAASDMMKNFISVVSNDSLFHPTVYLEPESFRYEGHTVIHVHVPPSAEVHSYKRVIYDRVDDADVKVTATGMLANMYIRKQNIYTERRIFPYAKLTDLRTDLLARARQAAVNHAMGRHPWQDMDDMRLLRSAGLYATDMATGETGFNLAAILLLGRDEVIQSVCPGYGTDAILRRVNLDRYDDRELIRTNLIESYDLLMEFARKHLPDKFFLEGIDRISLRDILAREMVSNTLMHREFTSAYAAKFVIMRDRMFTENANRASREGPVLPDNLEPVSKNPLIADFFRNIGRADRLGSGVRNLFKYSFHYSGGEPRIDEGDIFRITVPLDEALDSTESPDDSENDTNGANSSTNGTDNDTKVDSDGTENDANADGNDTVLRQPSEDERLILDMLRVEPALTQVQIQAETGFSLRKVKRMMARLQQDGLLERTGSKRKGNWQLKQGV